MRVLALGTLEERSEVGNLTGTAGRDGIDHSAAVLLEGVLEGVEAVLSGRIVGIGHDCGFRM
jgi:hypothetical protein